MSIADVLTKNNNLSLTNSIMESSRLSSGMLLNLFCILIKYIFKYYYA